MTKTWLALLLSLVVAALCGCSGDGDAGSLDDDDNSDEATLQTEEELRGGAAKMGLSDEDPWAVTNEHDPVLQTLYDRADVRSARKIIPWDVTELLEQKEVADQCARWWGCPPRAFADWLENFSAWRNGHRGVDAYVTLSFWNGTTVDETIPMERFKRTVKKLFTTYGGEGEGTATLLGKTYRFHRVKYWGLLNEPDLAPALTRHDPRLAARYYLAAREVAETACKGCVLVTGEFARVGASAFARDGYITKYFDEIRDAHVSPRVVSMHAYSDVNNLRTTATRRFLKRVNATFPDAKVWLTEEGTMLHAERYHLAGNRQKQIAAARVFLRLARLRGVDRVYFYNVFAKKPPGADPYQGPGTWDSGLLDWNDAPRPALCVLTRQAQSKCKGALGPSPNH